MRRWCRSILLVTFAAAPVSALGGAPAAPAGRDEKAPATQPAATRADRLAECVRLIREAKRPDQAIEAYARGCTLDATHVGVREAYLRRMLRFGRPQIAGYAAQVLIRLRPNHHLAWAVMGYLHGKRKEWAKAYEATALAVEGLADDPSVLHNMGQLVAWQEHRTPPPKLSDRARRAVGSKKSALRSKPQFAKGHASVLAFYQKQAKVGEEFDAKIAQAQAASAAVLAQGRAIDAAIRGLNDRIKVRDREIRRVKRRLDDTYLRPYYVDAAGRIVYDLEDSVLTRQYRRTLRDRLLDERRAIDELQAGIASLRRKAQPVLRDLARLRTAEKKLQRDKEQALGGVELAFRWDPPAVDGVVTPESPGPLALEIRKPRRKPVGPEAEAAQQLRLARLYLNSQMHDKAAAILRALLRNYPQTAAAKEARRLHGSIAPAPKPDRPK